MVGAKGRSFWSFPRGFRVFRAKSRLRRYFTILEILLALWNGKTEELLYLRYQNYTAEVGGEEENLNGGWSQYFIKELASDLHSLLSEVIDK